MKYHVLTANLPASLRLNLKHRLTGAGGSLTVAKNIADAVRLCAGQLCHLIVLVFTDLNACEEILTALRHVSFAPIVILADEYDSDQADVVLDAGADLCLPVKSPIGFLSGHVMAQLRRYTAYNNFESPQERENVPIQSGDIYIDPMRRIVKVKGQDVSLRPREFSLLRYFVRNVAICTAVQKLRQKQFGLVSRVVRNDGERDGLCCAGGNEVRKVGAGTGYRDCLDWPVSCEVDSVQFPGGIGIHPQPAVIDHAIADLRRDLTAGNRSVPSHSVSAARMNFRMMVSSSS